MRLAILIDFFGGGGKERRCLQLIKGLNRNNINDIHVVMIDDIVDYPDLYKTTAKVHIIERHGKYDLGVIKRLYKTLKEISPDVIMTWTLIKMSFYLCLIKPFLKCKYISAIVTAAQPIKKYTIDDITRFIAFKQADVIVGNSYSGIKAYKAPSPKSVVIYNGFDMERLNNLNPIDQVRRDLSLTTPFMVSMAARINRHKDYQTYIDAAKKVIAQRKDVTFYCIGKGELIDYYRNQLNEEEQKFIIFLGFRKDVDSILNASTVSVLCTNNKLHKEGVSNTILESMAYGIPVVATTGGGTDEIIINGETGFIIPPFEPSVLASKINMLLDNEPLRKQMGKKAIERIKTNFSLELMVKNYMSLFNRISC